MSSIVSTEKTFTVNAPWGKIAAISWGNPSSPPVLMAAGKMVPCTAFRPLIKLLPDCFFYVAIDMPGNGLSDRLPPGIRYTYFDLVPAIDKVVKHFKWEKLMYVGHSMGAVVGMYFNLAYPGRFTRLVELDPIPVYQTYTPEEFLNWYLKYYDDNYDDKNYVKHTSGKESAPKYTLDDIKKRLMKAHKIGEEDLVHVLDRYIEPAGDGLYRFTFDQRMKKVPPMFVSPDSLKDLLTLTKIPIFTVFAQDAIDAGNYSRVPFAFNTRDWPNNNYKFKIVNGGHDVHMTNPEYMADDIAKFLLEDLRAKL